MQVHEEMQRAESPRARAKAQAQRTYLTLASEAEGLPARQWEPSQ